jgi:pimeloyl-ACP methyl ester carboxylesterase
MLGHSSGGVTTLEAALTHPPTLRGIILYEPPVQLEAPLGAEAQARAEAAQARGDASEAMKIFFTDIVQLPPRIVGYMSSSPEFSGGWGEMQRLAPNQLEDNRAIRALPLGVERYLAIDVPALLLRGSESPKHLHERLDALARVIPMTEAAEMVGENHTANITAPERVAPIIEAFAKKRLG